MASVQRFITPFSPGRVLPISTTTTIGSSIAVLRKRIRTAKPGLISEGVDPEIYNIPRNLDVFPETLNSDTQSGPAVEQPIQYTLAQLKGIFQRGHREEDHIDSIFVSSARYCKQSNAARHEFLLLEVFDSKVPEITNCMILDRTVPTSKSPRFLASTSMSSASPANDRVRVSCYGDKELLIKQCGLRPYNGLEGLELSSPKSKKPLLLYELVILALEISEFLAMYNVINAQCFWFVGCLWESMQALRPDAPCIDITKNNSLGKFKLKSRKTIGEWPIDQILHRAHSEIDQFTFEVRRNQEATGLNKLKEREERFEALRKENEEMKREVERLKARMIQS